MNHKRFLIGAESKRNMSVEQLVRLYREGLSLRAIQKEVGTPRETVRILLKRNGVQLRKSMRDRAVRYHSPKNVLDEELAELLGLHAGDGYISDKWGITCNIADSQMIDRIIMLTKEVLGVKPIVRVRNSYGAVAIESAQSQIKKFFKGYGFPSGKKARRVKVPQQVCESGDLRVIRGFLRGLFGSDGCFSYSFKRKKKRFVPRVELQVMSNRLRDDFMKLGGLLDFDFCKYDYEKPFRDNATMYVAYTEKRENVIRWMKEIGTINDTHKKRYNEWLNKD